MSSIQAFQSSILGLAKNFLDNAKTNKQGHLFNVQKGTSYSVKDSPLKNRQVKQIKINDSKISRKFRYALSIIGCVRKIGSLILSVFKGRTNPFYLQATEGRRKELPFVAKHVATYRLDKYSNRQLSIQSDQQKNKEIQAIKEQLKTHSLLQIPLSTALGREPHSTSIVIDKDLKKVYFVDSKGSDLNKLKFVIATTIMKTYYDTVDKFLHPLLDELGQEYELIQTPNFQKVGDCAAVNEAIVRTLAAVKEESSNVNQADNPYYEIEAATAIVHENYDQIVTREIRSELQPKTERTSLTSSSYPSPKTKEEKMDDFEWVTVTD